jgi:hypothetical protein
MTDWARKTAEIHASNLYGLSSERTVFANTDMCFVSFNEGSKLTSVGFDSRTGYQRHVIPGEIDWLWTESCGRSRKARMGS